MILPLFGIPLDGPIKGVSFDLSRWLEKLFDADPCNYGNENIVDMANWVTVYVTPNHPVWLHPHGWVPMGRLYLPEKLRPGTIDRDYGEWMGRELILADGKPGAMLDVMDLYRTDRPEIAFEEEDDCDWGGLVDFSGPAPKFVPGELAYDYEKWGDANQELGEYYTTTVYNIEVEDWHTYFVSKTGL